jgi:hypothetical protein
MLTALVDAFLGATYAYCPAPSGVCTFLPIDENVQVMFSSALLFQALRFTATDLP